MASIELLSSLSAWLRISVAQAGQVAGLIQSINLASKVQGVSEHSRADHSSSQVVHGLVPLVYLVESRRR